MIHKNFCFTLLADILVGGKYQMFDKWELSKFQLIDIMAPTVLRFYNYMEKFCFITLTKKSRTNSIHAYILNLEPSYLNSVRHI